MVPDRKPVGFFSHTLHVHTYVGPFQQHSQVLQNYFRFLTAKIMRQDENTDIVMLHDVEKT